MPEELAEEEKSNNDDPKFSGAGFEKLIASLEDEEVGEQRRYYIYMQELKYDIK